MPAEWEQKARQKREALADKIPSECRLPSHLIEKAKVTDNILGIPRESGILSEEELTITENYDATALLERLTTGQLTASKVATAFCKRAAIAQQLTCCLTEIFFDQAIARAEELDRHLAATGKPVGPLHGIPISLKDSFNVKGVHTTLGYVSFLDRPPLSVNSPMVDLLLRAGAIIYVKTHLPQTMMTCDSHTNVFGRTRNPYSRCLTAGGSCGGEGALIAMRGSILGVGTDVGGSTRIPSFCCGITGFKASVGRLPFAGQTPPGRLGLAGGIGVALGPLSTSLRDADLFFRTIVSSRPEDMDDNSLGFSYIEPPPLKHQLTIGILPEDPEFPLQPPMYRTITTVAQKLAAAGHRVIDLPSGDLPSLASTCKLAFRFFKLDPDRTPLQNIKNGGEPYVPSLSVLYDLDNPGPEPTLRDLYDLNVAKAQVAAKMRQAWLKSGVDVVIAPAYQSCAPLHDTYGDNVYTVIWNVVDYPACVIPVGNANKAADAKFTRDVAYTPAYQPDQIEGAPCHVQIVGRRLKDEVLLQHAKVIDKILAEEN
ncbi:Putative General amidase-C [Source:UniProtKB/TrEMBL;Acc:Q9C1C7] [Aspergillus calidoustus]|uniref:Putative General amidase-C n=1 Tax=Aspergillus calidoustus TaxID=454130 RepID=A0A0U5GHS0_ASPCI|nr:Putative General amidase-C [Source:UniProtKB/TrEMBL;Acc:Q9C1C7] [Aspergillus calidoustus]